MRRSLEYIRDRLTARRYVRRAGLGDPRGVEQGPNSEPTEAR